MSNGKGTKAMFAGRHFDREVILLCVRWCGERKDFAAGMQGSRDRGADLLPVGPGVRWVEGRPGSTTEGTGAGEREAEASGSEPEFGEAGVEGHRGGKGPTLRSATDRPRRRRGTTTSRQGMEKWKAKYASHFPTPSTAARYRQNCAKLTS
jgi:hypothetical protein